jgi:hypothetical protein
MVLIKQGFIEVLLKHCSGLIEMKQIKENPPDIYHCLLPPALPRADISPRPLVEPLPPLSSSISSCWTSTWARSTMRRLRRILCIHYKVKDGCLRVELWTRIAARYIEKIPAKDAEAAT